MMEKTQWKLILSMCLKIVLIYLICSKISSKISRANETAVSKRVGSIDEKYHHSPNENHLPQMELDDATAKSHNSRDEDDESYIVLLPLLSEMHVNATKTPFLCSHNTFVKTRNMFFEYKNLLSILMLIIHNRAHPSNMITKCKPLLNHEIVVEYAPPCSFIISTFICCTFSLFWKCDCITSLNKFVMLFLASNVFTYFLICLIVTGSLSGIIYFLPIHVNFLFLVIMGWATIASCKVVFGMGKSHKMWLIFTSEMIENSYSFHVFHVTDAILFLFPMVSSLDGRSFIVHTSGNSLESVYFQVMANYSFDMMTQYTISILPALVSACGVVVVAVAFIYTRQQKHGVKMTDSAIQYTKYMYYYLFALVSWMCGFVAVTVPDYPHFWRLYFFMAMALSTVFLIDIIMNAKVRPSFLVERSENSEEVYQIRVKDV